MGQYGIDLFEVKDLHWHKFLALLKGVNDSTVLAKVMGYRSYEKRADDGRDPYEEMRLAWAIEPPMSEEEQEELDKFNNWFQ